MATWREATCDQAAVRKPTNPNCNVITLLHGIDDAIVQDQFDGYIRIYRHVIGDRRRKMETAERYGRVHPEPTAWSGLEFANGLFGFGNPVTRRCFDVDQSLTNGDGINWRSSMTQAAVNALIAEYEDWLKISRGRLRV
jgi:hypothetical protein